MSPKEFVKKLIRELCDAEELREDQSLAKDLGLDSLNMVMLLVSIEEALNITLDESDMNPYDLITVNDVLNLISKYEEI